MPEGGFFERRTISPTSLTIVILLHAAGIGALALSKMDVAGIDPLKRLKVEHIELEKPPKEVPPEPAKDQKPVPPQSQIDYVPPVVPSTPRGPVVLHDPTLDRIVYDPRPPVKMDERPTEPVRPLPLPEPKPPTPVRVEAQMRSGDLQPPYPASEEQAEREGKVAIRITIGTDGRVKAAAKVSATSDAFYKATERHALRAWRFSPSTVDGKPVESTKVMTVHFRLND
ncbi:MAG TPA: energy transducer TonB [Allosphingosinicella sp.]|jgi:protein TonB